jgi:DNA modification methylase
MNERMNALSEIGHVRICGCPPNHISCVTAKDWLKSQVAVWEFYYEGRDIRDKKIHPAVYPISLPARCIGLFTHRGELVLDPFCGTGSTLVAAQDLERNAVGLDLNENYVALAQSRVGESSGTTRQLALQADARDAAAYLRKESVALCVTSPPYANMLNRNRLNKSLRSDLRKNEHFQKNLQYSTDPRDLGTLRADEYAAALAEIYKGILPLLKPRAHCVINVNDLWEDNRRILLHVMVIEAMRSVGYELRNIIVWDKRSLVNKAGIYGWPNNFITLGITFEYLLDFWRP